MATLEQLIQDLLAPVEAAGRQRNASTAPTAQAAAALPEWMNPVVERPARWDWYDVESDFDGLEVTEHAVPPGWFERTFGISAMTAAV